MSGRRPVQFGLLRMLVALCPGFGTAVVGVACFKLGWKYAPWFSANAFGVMVCAWLCLATLFGWIDALLTPSLAKTDGNLVVLPLCRSVGRFVLLQILVAPPVIGFSAILIEQLIR